MVVAVTASVTDPDGSISGLTWQWISGATFSTVAAGITPQRQRATSTGATSDTYTPKAGDVGGTLTATASYFRRGDGPNDAAERSTLMKKPPTAVVAVDTRNRAPVFADQDTETDGVQNTETTRKVEENTKAIATDDHSPWTECHHRETMRFCMTTWAAWSRPPTRTPTKTR